LRRTTTPRPRRPVPRITSDAGSGTTAGAPDPTVVTENVTSAPLGPWVVKI